MVVSAASSGTETRRSEPRATVTLPARADKQHAPARGDGFTLRSPDAIDRLGSFEDRGRTLNAPRVQPVVRGRPAGASFTATDGGDAIQVQRNTGAQPVGGSGDLTDASYTVGPPTRPDIHHDNGFLQNPDDPSDPNPIPTEPAGVEDYAALAKWRAQLEAAEAVQGVAGAPHNDIPDGLAAYRHFLDGNGADRTFDYERFVNGDPAGKAVLENATHDIQLGAEQQYAEMIAKDPSLADKPVTFQLTGGPITVGGGNPDYPYPDTENWQKAIGAHEIWMSGTVTVTPPTEPGGQPHFDMDMTLHAEDRYNFNPGMADIATGTPDAENGRFERTGLAHQYTNYATLERQVSWDATAGATGTSTDTDPSRNREPSDNRRVRNRE